MENERFKNSHAGAAWHCANCGQPQMNGPIRDGAIECAECHEASEDCAAWNEQR